MLRKFFRLLFLIIMVVSFAIFLQNDSVLELKLIFWKKEVSLYFLTGSLFLSGFLVGLISYYLTFSRETKASTKSHDLSELE